MIRDYTWETLCNLKRKIDEIQGEIEAEGENWSSWQTEFSEIDFGEIPYSMQKSQTEMALELQELTCRWNDELYRVHQAEENCAVKLSEIKELMGLYEQRLRSVAEMLQPEKIVLDRVSYQAQLESTKGQYSEKKAEIQLIEQYLTKDQLENLKKLGYTGQVLLELCGSFQIWDIVFFSYLADGTQESYLKAFQMRPNLLDENMSIVMADYARRLAAADSEDCAQLEMLNNALLLGYELLGNKTYSECYLQMMSRGTDALLKRDTALLAMMDPASEEYRTLSELHHEELCMFSLWMSEDTALKEFAEKKGDSNLFRARIEEMNRTEDGCFSFRMYHGLTLYCEESETSVEVKTTFHMTPIELSLNISANVIKNMEKKLAAYWSKAVDEITVDIAWSLISYIVPMSKGVSGLADGLGIGLDVTETIQGYYELEQELKATEIQEMARYIYIGGSCEIDGERRLCFYGLYDPEIYRRLMMIEQDGLVAVMGWSSSEIGDREGVIEEFRDQEEHDKADLYFALLYGGFSFETYSYVNQIGEIVTVEVNDVFEAIDDLNAENFASYEG